MSKSASLIVPGGGRSLGADADLIKEVPKEDTEGFNDGSKGAPQMMDDIRVPRSMLTLNRFMGGV